MCLSHFCSIIFSIYVLEPIQFTQNCFLKPSFDPLRLMLTLQFPSIRTPFPTKHDYKKIRNKSSPPVPPPPPYLVPSLCRSFWHLHKVTPAGGVRGGGAKHLQATAVSLVSTDCPLLRHVVFISHACLSTEDMWLFPPWPSASRRFCPAVCSSDRLSCSAPLVVINHTHADALLHQSQSTGGVSRV